MQRTYKFRLYPTKEQEAKLLNVLEMCRLVYNSFLDVWNKSEKIPSRYTLQAMLPSMKEEKPELKKVYAKTLQMVLFVLYNNLKALSGLKKKGKKVGRLRYKKYRQFKSFILNQLGFKVIKTNNRFDRLYISKVGYVLIQIHREIEGKVKQVIIKQYKTGEWYALIFVERDVSIITKTVEKVIGLDVGIKFFLSDSDGRQIENPKFYKKTLDRLRMEHQKLSHKKRGSQNRKKQILQLNKMYQHLTNQRDDFLHKLSRFYTNNYDLISIENLNVSGMSQNHRLSQSILDASWGKFFGMLLYKAESAGKIVAKVNPRGTSKEHKYGEEIDRDYNASINILERGLVGQGLSFESSEIDPLRELIFVSASSIVEAGSPLR